jgi:hypothetical protein
MNQSRTSRLYLLLVLLTIGQIGNAQQFTQTIKGRITDAESRQPIVGATVLVLGMQSIKGATTDTKGYFKLSEVPVGRHSIKISSVGYDENLIQELVVGSGKEVELSIQLNESLQQLAEVNVKSQKEYGAALNEMASVSARSFSVEQAKRYAAAINDPARMALSFAGVASNSDDSNALIIRGNSPKGVLWRMEGVEIPNPNHFGEEGSTGGGISALSVNVLANSDFFTSAFPAEYGNATSGVFDLKLRKGNNEKREYAMQLGVMGLDVAAEGPLGKKGGASYLANYRYSTLAILSGLGINPAGDATPEFQDGAFKLHFPIKQKAMLSVWGMGGLSRQIRRRVLSTDAFHSDRGVLGLNYVHFINERTYTEVIASWAAFRTTYEYNRTDRIDWEKNNYTNQAYRLSGMIHHKINARHALRTGLIMSNLSYKLYDIDVLANTSRERINQRGYTQLWQAYGQWKYRVSPAFTLNLGTHLLGLRLNRSTSIEPRLGLRWQVAPRHALTGGVGIHSRTEAISMYLAQVRVSDTRTEAVNRQLKLMKSLHSVLGYEYRPAGTWRLQVEGYYQHHYQVPIGPTGTKSAFLRTESLLNLMDGYVTDSLVSDGKGRNYGVELTVERFLTRGVYLLATTSLYQAKYTARDGVERNSRFNGNFVQNVLAGKEWKVGRKQSNLLALNLRGLWAGGNRYIPIDLAASRKAGRTIRNYTAAYSEQLPAYFRLDTRISFTKNRKRSTSTVSIDVQNLTNRANFYQPLYDNATKSIRFDTQMGLIPILNWRLEF